MEQLTVWVSKEEARASLVDVNSSGQGTWPQHREITYAPLLESFGYVYSHSTPVSGTGKAGFRLLHTFVASRENGRKHRVSCFASEAATQWAQAADGSWVLVNPGWAWEGSWEASSRRRLGLSATTLRKYLHGVRSHARRAAQLDARTGCGSTVRGFSRDLAEYDSAREEADRHSAACDTEGCENRCRERGNGHRNACEDCAHALLSEAWDEEGGAS